MIQKRVINICFERSNNSAAISFLREQEPSTLLIAFDWWCYMKRQITRQTAALATKSHRFPALFF